MADEPKIEIIDVGDDQKTPKQKSAHKKSSKKKKESNFTYVYLGIIALLIVAGALLYIFQDQIFGEEQKREVIANVNGEPLYRDEFERNYNRWQLRYGDLISRQDALNQTIAMMLLLQEAKNQGLTVNETSVDENIELLKARLLPNQTIEDVLALQNMTLEDLKEELRKQVLLDSLLDTLITDEDIEEYYEGNIERFTAQPGQIRARHILVNSSEEAQEIIQELVQGADFIELAMERSIWPSGVRGGDLGFFDNQTMVQEFSEAVSEAAFNLKVGEVSQPVQTQFGWHIIRREADTIPFEEVEALIRQTLVLQKVPEFIEELRQKAEIEIFEEAEEPEEVPEEPEEVPEELPEEVEELPEVVEEVEEAAPELESFTDTGELLCINTEGKPIVRMYSATFSQQSKWIGATFDKVMKEYSDRIKAYHFELNTGDDTLTEEVETNVPQAERELFIKFNPESTVPTFVFGCRYLRVGNYFEDLELEEKEFRAVIEAMVG